LHDPQPGELERRRQHVLSEITREPESRRLSWLSLPPLRLRYAMPAVAVICAGAVSAVVFTGALGGKQPVVVPAHPMAYDPLNLVFTRDASGALTAISVTANAALLDATASIQVIHGHVDTPADVTPSQVVFQEQVPLTNIASPASGPPGTVALSTWSGSLSPNDWTGGCQSGSYQVSVSVSPVHPTQVEQDESALSESFTCSPS
jgi:hypothetical protein